ncbi:MAG TPA: class I poly(R)-hydroxyalkanoic acid synthase [Burkholderiaceae bacterium]|nr:class I poly(R)-hydroxyalkanoic acid synthase [Burkholderiaceae bacterium]
MPQPSHDPMQMLASMFEAGQEVMRKMAGAQPPAGASATGDAANPFLAAARQFADMQQAWLKATSAATSAEKGAPDPFAPFMASAQQFGEMQKRMLDGLSAFRFDVEGAGAGATEDKRFAGEAWRKDPRYAALSKAYLAYADFLHKSVDAVPVDERARAQMRFGVRQAIDAMSPSNFFLTNPEAAQLALETGGRSLTEGVSLFMRDLAKGRVLMTDEAAFEVGKNVGTTPGSVIFENELMQVIQYTPTTSEVFERPLVMIPPCINKFYILDLQPDNSFVANAVAQGHTVFLVSWRNVTEKQGALTWDDYVRDGVLTAIDIARAVSGSGQVNALGFCVGGTLLGTAAGVLAANDEHKLTSLTLLTTLLDFYETGEIGLLVTEESVRAREAAIGRGGILPAKEMGFIFSSLRANDLIWQYVVNSYLKGKAPPAFDLLYWNSDSTNLSGPMACWLLRNGYLENKLREPGKLLVCNVPLDLADVKLPAYLYASREDHIVPWKTAFVAKHLLGGDSTFVLGASGHIAGVINPPAKKKRNYWIEGTPAEEADEWFAGARSVPGSWWPHWSEWLARHAGERVPAPARPGNENYRVIEPAPGRYVMAKAD